MQNYRLNMNDYRYEKETAVLIGTMTISAILVALMFVLALPLGIGFLISILILFINLHSAQASMLGSCVKVGENQFPKIYNMARIASERLDIKVPPVYIMQSPVLNAFATGFFGHYYVVLHSAILEACTDEELLFIIGHECSHIKGNHVMLNVLMNMGVGNGMRLLPGLSWLQAFIQFVFLYLGRCFEYTCDRGGLIANGDVKSFITAQTKLAVGKELFKQLNIMEFYKQALELEREAFGFMGELEATHPLTVNRIRHAVRFYRSDVYRRIAAMQGKSGTATLQGSLATGDLLQRILDKPDKKGSQVQNQNKGAVDVQRQASVSIQAAQHELCSKCGSARKGKAPFCITCGTKFEDTKAAVSSHLQQEAELVPVIPVEEAENKFCIKCGAQNVKKAGFCTECGEKF